jgi:hypothetical protein
VLVNVPVSPAVAGEGYTVEVSVLDAFGNSVSLNPGGSDPLVVNDASGPIACNWQAESSSGVQTLDCVSTVAIEETRLNVVVGSFGLTGESNIIEVVNGALGVVAVGLSVSELTAGEVLDATLQGSDVYGNPYIVQQDPVVLIVDDMGGMIETPVSLGADGTAVALGLQPTLAGDPVLIQAQQNGQVLGEAPLVVLPAEISGFEVAPARTWSWVEEQLGVSVRAQDVHGNTVVDYAGIVTLASADGGLAETQLDILQNGEVDSSVVLITASIASRIHASDAAGIVGESDEIDVLERNCQEGPTADLLLGGQREYVGCLVNGSKTIAVDFSQSVVASGRSVAAYHLLVGDSSQRTLANSSTLKESGEGSTVVLLVVADDAACGGETEAVVWLSEQDDTPAGPITVGVADSVLTGGSAVNGVTPVSVQATDCEMDVAAGQSVYARVGLGDLGQLSPSGFGLSMVLDASGQGTFELDASASIHGGVATLEVGTIDGASYGSVDVTIEGDSALPEVVSVDPMGSTAELFDGVEVQFSEPMRDSSISDSTVSLLGPLGAVSLASTDLDASGQVLTLVTAETGDASDGTYVLTLSSSIADDGGNNQLTGDFSGLPADYVGQFGAVGDEALTLLGCVSSTTELVVDGDDGTLSGDVSEADQVEIQASASGAVTWWVLEVLDSQSERIRTTRISGTGGASSVVTWDGRGDDGVVCEPGSYFVSVSTLDIYDNLSAPCEIEVELLQHYSTPESP